MFYQTEAKPQCWRAVAVFDDRSDMLLYLNRSSTQVRAGYRNAFFELLDEEEREHEQHRAQRVDPPEHDTVPGRRRIAVAISRGGYASLAAYQQRMGWRFPWYSSEHTDFNFDLGVFGHFEQCLGNAHHDQSQIDEGFQFFLHQLLVVHC